MKTVEQVRRQLVEINKWRVSMGDVNETILGISSPRLTFTTGSSGIGDGLTGQISRTIDIDQDGAEGIRTEPALLDLFTSWANSFAFDRTDPKPQAPLTYLANLDVLEWASVQADWEAFTEDTTTIHSKLAHLLGYTPTTIAKCPHCNGDVQTQNTNTGQTDWATCNTCDTWYRDLEDITHHAKTQMRSPNTNPNTTITTRAALKLWPNLNRQDIQNWQRAGKLQTPINLKTLNQLAHSLTNKRTRWKRN